MRYNLSHMVSPIYYKGDKIIRISDMPEEQSHLFSGWVQPEAYLKLEELTYQDCVSYADYEYWFQNYFIAEKDLNYLI